MEKVQRELHPKAKSLFHGKRCAPAAFFQPRYRDFFDSVFLTWFGQIDLSIQKTIWKREPSTGLRGVTRKRYFFRNWMSWYAKSRLTQFIKNVFYTVSLYRNWWGTPLSGFDKKAPEDEAQLEELRSSDHELHFTKTFLGHVREFACC